MEIWNPMGDADSDADVVSEGMVRERRLASLPSLEEVSKS